METGYSKIFAEQCRETFRFLSDEYGFREREQESPERVCFVNKTTEVEVVAGGLGQDPRVILHRLKPIPGLWNSENLDTLVEGAQAQGGRLRLGPLRLIIGLFNRRAASSGLSRQLGQQAELLKKHASEILQGDFAAFDKVQTRSREPSA